MQLAKSAEKVSILVVNLVLILGLAGVASAETSFSEMMRESQNQEEKENFAAFNNLIDLYQIAPKFSSRWQTWGSTTGRACRLDSWDAIYALTRGDQLSQDCSAQRDKTRLVKADLSKEIAHDVLDELAQSNLEEKKASVESKLKQGAIHDALRTSLGASTNEAVLPEGLTEVIEEKAPEANAQNLEQLSEREVGTEEISEEEFKNSGKVSAQVRAERRLEALAVVNSKLELQCPNYRQFATVKTQYPIRRVCKKLIKVTEHEERFKSLDNAIYYQENKVLLDDSIQYTEDGTLQETNIDIKDISNFFEAPKTGAFNEERVSLHYLREGTVCIQEEVQIQAQKILNVDWSLYAQHANDCLDVRTVVRRAVEHQVADIKERIDRLVETIHRVTMKIEIEDGKSGRGFLLATPVDYTKSSELVGDKIYRQPSKKFTLRPSLQAEELADRVGPAYFNQGESIKDFIHWTPKEAVAVVKRDIAPAFRLDIAVVANFFSSHHRVEKVEGKYQQTRDVFDQFMEREKLLGPFQRLACLINGLRNDNKDESGGQTLIFAVHDKEVNFLSRSDVERYDDILRSARERGDCKRRQTLTFDRNAHRRALRAQRIDGGLPPIVTKIKAGREVEVYENL